DWEPCLLAILEDVRGGRPVAEIADGFHNGLVDAIADVAAEVGESRVALTGGCFQNRLLLTRTIRRLRGDGFEPYWHQRIPPNDGGLAVGQVAAFSRQLRGTLLCA
ncbi:MAG TPA: carbamoyltransferase HypF, partial [Elusimicrobiota bacterium]|nr:carbamoyltransferase HypF [Elusimicrobiota bacterium]